MKPLLLLPVVAALAFGADKKAGPAEASSETLSFTATVLMDRAEIEQALGADLGDGFVVIRLQASPKGEKPVHISPDDYTLLSRKDGEKSPALAPSQIAGRATLTVKAADQQPTSWGSRAANGTVWSGVGLGRSKTQPADTGHAEPSMQEQARQSSDEELLAALKQKILPEADAKQPVEGLLYFRMDGKNKLKDLSLLYKGDAGRMVADFK